MDKLTAMKSLESKFTSHNSVEVERATITREEFEAIKASQWISVEDELPAHGKLVIAAHLYEFGTEPDCTVCCFYGGAFIPHTDGLEANSYDGRAVITLDMDVTHWAPLPKGPTE